MVGAGSFPAPFFTFSPVIFDQLFNHQSRFRCLILHFQKNPSLITFFLGHSYRFVDINKMIIYILVGIHTGNFCHFDD